MNETTPTLEVHVHLVDGSRWRFVQPDPVQAQRVLAAMRAERLFAQRQLAFSDAASATVFPASAVTRVDLLGDDLPSWPFGEGIASIDELTESEFAERRQAIEAGFRPPAGPPPPGIEFTLLAEVGLSHGSVVRVAIHAEPPAPTPPPAIDRALVVQRLLAAPAFCCRRHGGGVILLNPARVVRLAFYPGPPEVSPGAWPATSVDG